MILDYQESPLFIWGFQHALGSARRSLEELKALNALGGSVDILGAIGYEYNRALGPDETLLDLAAGCLGSVLNSCPKPRALVFQHCYSESAVMPWAEDDSDLTSRSRYLQPVLMNKVGLDDIPYFCSFASGCAGLLFALTAAAGLREGADATSIVCLLADANPRGATFDMLKERILNSEHSSAFIFGSEPYGYQLFGINHYSTTRTTLPLLELVKRAVAMVQEVAASLKVDLRQSELAIHYPNIFPKAWEMVGRGLRLPHAEHIVDGFADRAHCGGSDSVISLAHQHRGREGRLHVVVNYGVGLHLAVAILREKEAAMPEALTGS